MAGFWRNNRPPQGTPVTRGHPLAYKLAGLWLPFSGGKLTNCVSGPDMTLLSTATIDGRGMVCDATDKGADCPLPSWLQFGWPMSIVVRMTILAAPGDYSTYFSLAHNNTNAAPISAIQIGAGAAADSGGQHIRGVINSAGSNIYNGPGTGGLVSLFVGRTLTASLVVSLARYELWLNNSNQGVPGGLPTADPTYGATPLVTAADYTGPSSNCNVIFHAGWLYNRELSPDEIYELGRNPWCMFADPVWRSYPIHAPKQPARVA